MKKLALLVSLAFASPVSACPNMDGEAPKTADKDKPAAPAKDAPKKDEPKPADTAKAKETPKPAPAKPAPEKKTGDKVSLK